MLDALQTVLDIVGFMPGVGNIADGINVGICLLRADLVGATLYSIGLIEFVGIDRRFIK